MEAVIELPDNWVAPTNTLAPLLAKDDPQWVTIMNYVCVNLLAVGNPTSVLESYRDQAMSGDFRHLVQVSMAFMGEIELEHEAPVLN